MTYNGNNGRFYRRPVEKPVSFNKVKLDASTLDAKARAILKQLSKAKTAGVVKVVKGRYARLGLKFLPEINEKIEKRYVSKEEGGDLDIALVYSGISGRRRIEFLVEQIAIISEAIQDTLEENHILFREQDIEPIRGKFVEGAVSDETIRQILMSRDLTINQVVLILEDGAWYICYTDLCQEHTISGVGMLNPMGRRVTRLQSGKIVPTNRGLVRLLKFFSKGIVDWIYVPTNHLVTHFAEMKRLQEIGKESPGTLGKHGLVVACEHKSADLWTKSRLMSALYGMRFTNLRDFNQWAAEQKKLNGNSEDGEFIYKKIRPVEEALAEIFAKNRERQENQTERRRERDNCRHEFKTITCHGCNVGCKVKRCTECTRYIVVKPEDGILPCNKIFKNGNHLFKPWDLRTFFPLPQKEEPQGLSIGDFPIRKIKKKKQKI